jgi:hypothetical protein
MLTNKSLCEYINLYNVKGNALSCHVTLTSITGSAAKTDQESAAVMEKWAVLTIRSASVVGNSKLSGIGLLGIDHIPMDTLRERLDAYRLNKEQNSNKSVKNIITSSTAVIQATTTVSTSSKSKKKQSIEKTGVA